eukprot:4274886-Amphidinium_carterae.1
MTASLAAVTKLAATEYCSVSSTVVPAIVQSSGHNEQDEKSANEAPNSSSVAKQYMSALQ